MQKKSLLDWLTSKQSPNSALLSVLASLGNFTVLVKSHFSYINFISIHSMQLFSGNKLW